MKKFIKKILSTNLKNSTIKPAKKTIHSSFLSIKDPGRRAVAEKIDRDFGKAIERFVER